MGTIRKLNFTVRGALALSLLAFTFSEAAWADAELCRFEPVRAGATTGDGKIFALEVAGNELKCTACKGRKLSGSSFSCTEGAQKITMNFCSSCKVLSSKLSNTIQKDQFTSAEKKAMAKQAEMDSESKSSSTSAPKSFAEVYQQQLNQGKEIQIDTRDKDGNTVRTTYTDDDGSGGISEIEKKKYVLKETGTGEGTNFVRNQWETPQDLKSDEDSKFTFVNPETHGTVRTNDPKVVQAAAAKSNSGTIEYTDPKGKQIVVNSNGEMSRSGVKKKENQTPEEAKKEKQAMTDPCHFSTSIDAKYRCQGTANLIKGAEIGNAVLGTAGKTIVTTIGQTAAAKSQNGSMSSGYEGSAKMAKTTFTYEAALTAMNLAATVALAKKTKIHKNNAAEIRAMTVNINDDDHGSQAARIEKAGNEQENQQNKANAATYVTALKGVESLSNAMVAKKIQKDAQKAANLSKQIEAKQNKPGIVWDSSAAMMAGNYDPNQANLAGGTATETTDSLDSSNPNGDTTAGGNTNLLGNGKDLSGGDNTGPEEHTPGAFKTAAGGGSSGGGSGGGAGGGAAGGGGGGAPSEENKAGYASEFGTKERYESGGGAGGKGGSGKAGGKDDTGIDLNGLLAQFLPKTEEDLGPKNGILDFAGSGRAPAAVDESASYLDKNADLFQRIHETMSEKNRKGHVGI